MAESSGEDNQNIAAWQYYIIQNTKETNDKFFSSDDFKEWLKLARKEN